MSTSGSTSDPYPQAPRFTIGTAEDNNNNNTTNSGIGSGRNDGTNDLPAVVRGTPASLDLGDLFGDCFFTPEGDTVFLSDHADLGGMGDGTGTTNATTTTHLVPSTETTQAPIASRIGPDGTAIPIYPGGGIETTNLNHPGQRSTVMGSAPSTATPSTNVNVNSTNPHHAGFVVDLHQMSQAQQDHHMGYISVSSQETVATNATIPAAAGMGGPAPGPMSLFAASSSANNNATTTTTGAGNNVSKEVKKRRQRPGTDRKMSEQQKSERRERNREHAKRSRIRKKFLLESLQQSVALLKEENESLRSSIRTHLGEERATELLTSKNLEEHSAQAAAASNSQGFGGGGSNSVGGNTSLIATDAEQANQVLDDPDFSFIKALQTAQQNFVVTDPSLPDNPIVYATQGFLNLTGYTLDQVLGRNCRFLQGPETDPKAVEKIRRSIEDGSDMSVCLLNYRADGTTFWNQFFIAALRDAGGNITNYVGVQCKVSDSYAATVCQKQQEDEEQHENNNNEDEMLLEEEDEQPPPHEQEDGDNGVGEEPQDDDNLVSSATEVPMDDDDGTDPTNANQIDAVSGDEPKQGDDNANEGEPPSS